MDGIGAREEIRAKVCRDGRIVLLLLGRYSTFNGTRRRRRHPCGGTRRSQLRAFAPINSYSIIYIHTYSHILLCIRVQFFRVLPTEQYYCLRKQHEVHYTRGTPPSAVGIN